MNDFKEPKIYFGLNYKPRENQLDAIEFFKENIIKGKRFFLMDLPTGSGKSYFAIMLANWYRNYVNKDAKFDILTNTKILQNQYKNEFNFIADLKGKNSYMCNTFTNMTCQEGKEMNLALKRKCNNCPYDTALSNWRTADMTITNFHLFDTFNVFLPDLMKEKQTNVLIIDEAHQFEAVLCEYISTTIDIISLKSMGFSDANLAKIQTEMKFIKTIEDYIDYLNNIFFPKITSLLDSLKEKLSRNEITNKDKIKISKNISSINTSMLSYLYLVNEYNINPDNWVIEITKNNDKKNAVFENEYKVQPVWSYKYLNDLIFNKYDHIIFMSGTILDKEIFSFLNGFPINQSAYYSQNSNFPIKNRPIYYIKNIGKMTFNEKETTWKNQIPYIKKIIKKYDNKKGIIHTSNYEISKWVEKEFGKDERFIFHDSDSREDALQKHISSDKPTILVSPSMMEGIDLYDSLSRFQIILKIPFPNLASKRNKKRMDEHKDWYGWKTCLDLIQSLGRSIRSENDYADSFILDGAFSNILQYNYKYIPSYIMEAIKIMK